MKDLTSIILNYNKDSKLNKRVLIPALIGSFFSVLFSLTIVVELYNIVNGFVFFVLLIFTILFLVFNETIKLREIKKTFKGNKFSIIGFLFTFMVSVSLSSIGIYFATNKSLEIENKIVNNKAEKIANLETEFLNKISTIQLNKFESTTEYKILKDNLTYWKNKKSATLEERTEIREHIRNIESDIKTNRTLFNESIKLKIDDLKSVKDLKLKEIETLYLTELNNISYNNVITYIFLIIIMITEIGIIIMNIDVAKYELSLEEFINSKQAQNYMITRNVLLSLFLVKNNNDMVSILNAQCSPVLNKLNWSDDKKWSEVKKLYNLFIHLGILSEGEIEMIKGKKILTNRFMMNEEEAFNKFDTYFNQLLSI